MSARIPQKLTHVSDLGVEIQDTKSDLSEIVDSLADDVMFQQAMRNTNDVEGGSDRWV